MIFVFHAADETAFVRIDGRLFMIPPNELFDVPEIRGTDMNNNGPFEYIMPERLVAEKLVEHCWTYGLVIVEMKKGPKGFTTDIEDAKVRAEFKLNEAQDTI